MLKRRLQDYGSQRRGNEVDVDQLRDLIRNQISGSGQGLGYRAVWHSLRLVHRIHVPDHLVADSLGGNMSVTVHTSAGTWMVIS